jgi:hypothetical protein
MGLLPSALSSVVGPAGQPPRRRLGGHRRQRAWPQHRQMIRSQALARIQMAWGCRQSPPAAAA